MMKKNAFTRKIMIAAVSALIGLTTLTAGFSPKAGAVSASVGSQIINYGDNFLGVPYRFGARSGITSAFDCSSFTQYVYKKFGITLPRLSKDQAKVGTYVPRSSLKVGDLVFFRTSGKGVGHVAIYAGNNKILHTYGEGGVRFSSLSNAHWNSHYITARRVS